MARLVRLLGTLFDRLGGVTPRRELMSSLDCWKGKLALELLALELRADDGLGWGLCIRPCICLHGDLLFGPVPS